MTARARATRWRSAIWIAAAALALVSGIASRAQAQDDPAGALRIVDVELRGSLEPFRALEIQDLLRTQPNRRFLGIPGFTPSLWLYEAGTERTVVGRALMRAGEPPAIFSPDVVATDVDRLRVLYNQAGFLDANVVASVDTLGGNLVRVAFTIEPGPPALIRQVVYRGLSPLAPDERSRLASRSELALQQRQPGDPAGDSVFAARDGQRLAEADLMAERRRLLSDLRDIGFARVTRDSIRAVAFPLDTLPSGSPVFDVELAVGTGPRFAFGDVRFRVTGPESDAPRVDTTAVGSGRVITSIVDDRRLSPRLLRRALRFEPGDVYSQQELLTTRRRLDRTGVFSFIEVVQLPGEIGAPAPGDSLLTIPHRITLRTRQRHSIRLEGFVLQRTGILGGEGGLGEQELGFGAGAVYRNANTFGGGEQFSVGMNASVAGDFVDFPTAQAEATVALTVPYLLWPFGGVERTLDLDDARSQITFGFLTARRDELRLLIRGRATAGLRYELNHTPSVTSLVDVLDFRLSDPDTLSGFRQQFLDLIEDPVARQFVLEDYTRPQINNALRYTLRSLTADPLRRDRGHAAEAALEFGGNLPYLLDRYVFTPGVVEGSIPGVPLFGGGGRLEYRPYARATLDGRHYLVADRLTIVASRAIVGVAHPTARTPVVPFDRRFYAGGAGSVRGWELRQLGPGRIPPETSAFVQGGDIRLEASVEVRRIVLRRLFAADWQLAAFTDVGNVWFGPRNPGDAAGRFRASTFYEELAVGSGVGVRALWDFLILRLDLAWKVRSPVPGEALLPDGNRPRLHFGIGQSF